MTAACKYSAGYFISLYNICVIYFACCISGDTMTIILPSSCDEFNEPLIQQVIQSISNDRFYPLSQMVN